jgi:hypothetical protein
MASRKMHLVAGTLFWGIFLGIFYALDFIGFIDLNLAVGLEGLQLHSIWIVLSFMTAHFGAQLPDYDIIWKKALPHRNILTHSVILPAIVCIPLYTVNDATNFLVPIYAFYLIGHASHLFFDLRPESWKGSALIHIFWVNEDGRKTLPAKASRMFLLINGIVILAAGIIMLYFFQLWV